MAETPDRVPTLVEAKHMVSHGPIADSVARWDG